MERHHNLVNTDQKHDRGKHLGNDDKSQECGLAFEFHSGQGVSSRNAAEHSQKSRTAGNDDGIQHVAAHRC